MFALILGFYFCAVPFSKAATNVWDKEEKAAKKAEEPPQLMLTGDDDAAKEAKYNDKTSDGGGIDSALKKLQGAIKAQTDGLSQEEGTTRKNPG